MEADMPADNVVVRVEGVTFAYDTKPVLKDAGLQVTAGDFASVVGPNGGGKSTLLKLILGLLQPNRGRVRVFDRSPGQVRQRMGYMPQYAQHDPQFPVTAMDVVLMGRLGGSWGGPYSKEDREAAREALEEMGVADLAPRLIADLSGGQRQRVLIARALCGRPDLLLLDEPTSNVDIGTEEKLYEVLQRLNERMTILMVSHDLGVVSRKVKSVICVNQRIMTHSTTDLTGGHIRELYKADMRMVRHDPHVH
ncbi:MAG: ATP-binding cassette domain-containing protein [Candidatus Eisenbacteria bacterium]|nr:ATP-binding cassette domain-containing protein [Candidatus Eisenbacteria bacterium]